MTSDPTFAPSPAPSPTAALLRAGMGFLASTGCLCALMVALSSI